MILSIVLLETHQIKQQIDTLPIIYLGTFEGTFVPSYQATNYEGTFVSS